MSTPEIAATPISGAHLIRYPRFEDERGTFERTYDDGLIRELGFKGPLLQQSICKTRQKGTVRGMHFQIAPHSETKIVRCLHGAILDVIFDLRVDSPSFGVAWGCELSEENRLTFVVPRGCAHGYQTLTPDTLVEYSMDQVYVAEAASGVRHDDPLFRWRWPSPISYVAAKDMSWPTFRLGNSN